MSNIIDKIQLSGVTYDIGGQGGSGVSVVEVTQAEYDALPSSAKTDTSKMYVITDAEAGDLTNYYTKTETNTLLGGKQDTLVSSVNIKTINNTSILGSGNIDIQGGGGGKAIEAGRGISVTTGETADTVSFNLPISAGTGDYSIIEGQGTETSGNYSHAEGRNTKANGMYSHAEGINTKAEGNCSHAEGDSSIASGNFSHAEGRLTSAIAEYSHAEGNYTKTSNNYEHASGLYNNSVSASTTFGDSGNTLFSVGNGTADNARHNAFEIRQNGDIYITSGNTDIKLQDHLGGGGGGSITIDPSLNSGSTNAVANSAITNAFNSFVCRADYLDGHPRYYQFRKYGDNSYVQIYNFKINGTHVLNRGFAAGGVPYNYSLVETSAITTSITSSSTDAQVPSAKAVNDKLGGLSLVKLTQSEYDALATKDSNTLYVIVN